MKIHLVSPRNPESFWTFDRLLPALDRRCMFPNLSLPTVAALTPPGHEVSLCDENVEDVDFEVDADIIGLTGYVVHLDRVLALARAFRARGRTVVVGGPLATLVPERLRGQVDVIFIGEAEETWPAYIRDLERGLARTEYVAQEKPDMHASPIPRFDLMKHDRYRTMAIQFARGCPFTCEFCEITAIYGRRPRTKRVEQVVAEVEEVLRHGMTSIFIVDDNFIGNKKEAKRLLEALARWQEERGYPVDFVTEVSLNVAQDSELLGLMRDAGFDSIFVGIESPKPQSLAGAKKNQNLREDLVEAVHRIQSYGIEVMAGMIVGFDEDDASIFDEQFRFIQEARIPISMTGMLNAIPQTPLFARLERENRLVEQSLGDQLIFTNIVPQGMTRDTLMRGYACLLQQLYDPVHFGDRAIDLVLGRGERVVRRRRYPTIDELKIVGRTLWTCVVRATPSARRMTLRILRDVVRKDPRRLPDAFRMILTYKHLHEYAGVASERILEACVDEEVMRESNDARAVRAA